MGHVLEKVLLAGVKLYAMLVESAPAFSVQWRDFEGAVKPKVL